MAKTRLERKALGGYEIRFHPDGVYQVIRENARPDETPLYTSRDILCAEEWRRLHVREQKRK